MTDDDYDALSQKQLASIKRDMRISLEDAAVRATHKVVADLTEKNLEAALLNLSKTDRPITVKPTTWFGNPAKTAQWYKCPNCAKQSPLTEQELQPIADEYRILFGSWVQDFARAIEAKLRSKNT